MSGSVNLKPWKVIAKEKQDERNTLVEGMTSEFEVHDFLDATASQIVANIQSERPGWTAENVLRAYARRAAVAHKSINCLTEVMFEDALKAAKELDQEFNRTKTIKGPLHGVPFTLKDQVEVKGYDASIGFTQWSQQPCETDAEIVRQIRAAGGIPFVKTNVPQTMLAFECQNPVFGRTLNPYSNAHTCGGSSGGEAAVLACDGAALGIGSDVGGSLRIPVSYCGIYALKPGQFRMSTTGMRSCVPGFEAIRTVIGPMGRSVEDIELASRASLATRTSRWKLKFGYYKTDAIIRSCPGVERAVQETVDALRRQGHQCVEIEVPDILEATRIFVAITSSDKYETLTSHIGPDPKDASLFLVTIGPKLPTFIRNLAAWAARTFLHDEAFARLLSNSHGRPVKDYWAETAKRNNYRKLFWAEIWDKHGLDGIVCPVQALPSIPHDTAADLSPLAAPTLLYNVLDLPVGVVPVTRLSGTKDILTPEWDASGVKGSNFLYGKVYEGKNAAYNADTMNGIPIGVQIVGKHWEEEKVIAMMKVVDQALGPRGFGPGAWDVKAAKA